MNQNIILAWEAVEHWLEIYQLAEDGEVILPIKIDDCSFCREYVISAHDKGYQHWCKGCPIMQKTGEQFCQGTPYHAVSSTKDKLLDANMPIETVDSSPLLPVIRDEYAFIVGIALQISEENFATEI